MPRYTLHLLVLLLVAPLAGCELILPSTPDSSMRYGRATAVGDGIARSFVRLSAEGAPEAVGVVLTEAALQGLSEDHGDHGANSSLLRLPIAVAPYDHIALDWNPHGHEPEGLFTLPHFDLHFYMESETERATWMPSDPQWEEKVNRAPASAYVPAGFAPTPGGVPMMGAHWIDTSDPTYAPGGLFEEVFLWGAYDGEIVFAEPMITKAFLEARTEVDEALAQPAAWQRDGYYPTRYVVRYDHAKKEYIIALEGLTYRTAS